MTSWSVSNLRCEALWSPKTDDTRAEAPERGLCIGRFSHLALEVDDEHSLVQSDFVSV